VSARSLSRAWPISSNVNSQKCGVGDKVLQSVATRLVACVRRADTVSRLGGDEFVVLLSQVEREEDATYSARKILRSLSAPHMIDNKSLDLNASIGVSTYPSDGV
jgi:diguanylate cyclase